MTESDRTREGTWHTLTEAILTGMADWRVAHPAATFAELEAAVETRLSALRIHLLEEAALASTARTGGQPATTTRQDCAACGAPLVARGEQVRQVRVRGDGRVALRRTYLTCTACGRGLFPPG